MHNTYSDLPGSHRDPALHKTICQLLANDNAGIRYSRKCSMAQCIQYKLIAWLKPPTKIVRGSPILHNKVSYVDII